MNNETTDTGLTEQTLKGEVRRVVYASQDGAYSVLRVVDAQNKEQTVVGPIVGAYEGQGINLKGKWEISDGKLTPTGRGENRISFGDNELTDYELRSTTTLQQGKGYGIYYRADGKKNISGYCFQYDPGLGNKFVVRKVINGKETRPIQSERMPAGFPVTGQPHNISIAIEGDHHVIKVDNETVMNFKDDSFKSGSAGFRSWSKSKVEFDNVDIVQK